jgi:hypothetical protein
MWGPVDLVVLWVGAPELRETKSCSGIFWTCFHSSDTRQYGSHLASECRGPCYQFLTYGWSNLHPLHWGVNSDVKMLSYTSNTYTPIGTD